MKALTLNVHAWIEEDPLTKLKQLADVILEKDYDFIALQEVNQPLGEEVLHHENFIQPLNEANKVPVKKWNFAQVLVDELKKHHASYYWSWSSNHIGYDKYDEGLAFLSKTPFKIYSDTISHTTEYDSIFTRNILKIKVEAEGESWTCINGHFSWWQSPSRDELFKNEWLKTIEHITKDDRERLLVMGDLNNDAGVSGEGYDLIFDTAPFLRDSYHSAEIVDGEFTVSGEIDGWENHRSGKRIDYILAGEKIEVQEHRVIFDGRETPVVSDHFGVEMVFN